MRCGGTSLISGDDNPSTFRSSGVFFLATSPLLPTEAMRGPPPGYKLFRRLCGHHRQVVIVERIVCSSVMVIGPLCNSGLLRGPLCKRTV
jgi:hypothetical protein